MTSIIWNLVTGVADIIVKEGGICNLDLINASLLHDTVEDTDVTIEQIYNEFGESIGNIVQEVTDDKNLPKQKRKDLQVINLGLHEIINFCFEQFSIIKQLLQTSGFTVVGAILLQLCSRTADSDSTCDSSGGRLFVFLFAEKENCLRFWLKELCIQKKNISTSSLSFIMFKFSPAVYIKCSMWKCKL